MITSKEIQSMSEVASGMASQDMAIHVNNLRKSFKLYDRPTALLRELLTGRKCHTEYHALQDISFEVRHGEVVGILGRNGAGKSTLLKIVAGVLDHDAGDIQVNGRVAALLELGSGFSPEYSGRNNVLFGGMCLGMKKDEVLTKMDSIIDFAELRDVIDQPFKTYSSGMKARLTFATAISVDADILIIDEALAVGDALFAEKCFRKIKEIAEGGATIFFVTHSLGQIYELCSRGILLDHGRLIFDGLPQDVGHQYELLLNRERRKGPAGSSHETIFSSGNDANEELPESKAWIKTVEVVDELGDRTSTLIYGRKYRILAHVKFNEEIQHYSVGIRIALPSGTVVFGKATANEHMRLFGGKGEKIISFTFESKLANGQYIIGAGIAEMFEDGDFNVVHMKEQAMAITTSGGDSFMGLFDVGCKINVFENKSGES